MYRRDSPIPLPIAPASPAEHRAAVLRAEEDRARERQRELDSQVSPMLAAAERIQIWEKLHALRLPTSAIHPLVACIAVQTQLTLQDVAAEQQRRRLLLHSAVPQIVPNDRSP